MDTKNFKQNYISYYLLLEKDFENTIPYLTVAEDNYNAYSSVYLKLLLTIGSEIDVVLGVLAKEYEASCRENGFGCSRIIMKYEPDIKKLKVRLREENISILPWECEKIPDWWTAYNEIKHNRYEDAVKFDCSKKNYQFANQKNVLYSLAALFSLEMYAYRRLALSNNDQMFVPDIKTIFAIENGYWKDVVMGQSAVVIGSSCYML